MSLRRAQSRWFWVFAGPALLGFVAFLSIALWALLVTAALSGFLITDVRGV